MEGKCLFFLLGLKRSLEEAGSPVGDASERGCFNVADPR